MEEPDFADPELKLVFNSPENNFCNDCNKKDPRWCSINNAVLLCAKCTRKHRKYSKNVSQIKSLEGDLWSKEEIKRLNIGGNSRFSKMILSYNIPLINENAEYKYHTKAANYYRNLLDEELKGKSIINLIKPSLKEGIEILSKEEFDKLKEYKPSQNNNVSGNINISNNPNNNQFSNVINNNNQSNNNNTNWFGKVINDITPDVDRQYVNRERQDESLGNQWDNFTNSVSNVITNISEKAQTIDYNEKLRNAGNFIKDKKEKIENSQAFQGFLTAFSNGLESLVKKTEELFDQPQSNYSNIGSNIANNINVNQPVVRVNYATQNNNKNTNNQKINTNDQGNNLVMSNSPFPSQYKKISSDDQNKNDGNNENVGITLSVENLDKEEKLDDVTKSEENNLLSEDTPGNEVINLNDIANIESNDGEKK